MADTESAIRPDGYYWTRWSCESDEHAKIAEWHNGSWWHCGTEISASWEEDDEDQIVVLSGPLENPYA